jgi:hypothetical protein
MAELSLPQKRKARKSTPGGKGADPRRLLDDMLVYLTSVVASNPQGRLQQGGITAAGKVIDHCHWVLERELDVRVIHWLGGPERAAQWLAENRERLEAKLHGQQTVSPLALPLEDASQALIGLRRSGNPEQRATVGPTSVNVPDGLNGENDK